MTQNVPTKSVTLVHIIICDTIVLMGNKVYQ